jgi:transcriptional regulator with XRE-family HTH domain
MTPSATVIPDYADDLTKICGTSPTLSRQSLLPPRGGAGTTPGVEHREFGGLLRRFRQAAALTMEELAGLADLSPRAIWDLECGRTRRPRRSTIDALIGALALDEGQARLLAVAARPAPITAAQEVALEAEDPDVEPAVGARGPHGRDSPLRIDGMLVGPDGRPVPRSMPVATEQRRTASCPLRPESES